MAKKTKIIFMIVSGLILVVIGIFASILLIRGLQANQASVDVVEEILKTKVVILTRDLALGDAILAGDVELVDVPVELAPRNAISTLEEVIGKMVKTDLIQGEMVLSHNLANPTNNNKDLSFILGEEHVLMAFPADDLMSRESMVQRGDIVDIFATFIQEVKVFEQTAPVAGEPVEAETRTFTVNTLQEVNVTALVLDVIADESASNTSLIPGDDTQGTVSPNARIRAYLLALKPQDALILKHLKDTGAMFDIVLRAPTSTVQFDLTPVTEEFIIEYYGLEILP